MATPWLVRRRADRASSFPLVCFPHAGGGTASFHGFAKAMPRWIDAVPVELPGRERRIGEAPHRRMTALVEALDRALADELAAPHAFFGHSLGGLVAFELARARVARGRRAPAHLFVCAVPAPERAARRAPIHALPEADFRAALAAIGGLEREVLAHEELMELVSPVLRADFELYETYRDEPASGASVALDCPLTAIAGMRDPYVARADLEAWRARTRGPFALASVESGHFPLADAAGALADLVARALAAHAEVSA